MFPTPCGSQPLREKCVYSGGSRYDLRLWNQQGANESGRKRDLRKKWGRKQIIWEVHQKKRGEWDKRGGGKESAKVKCLWKVCVEMCCLSFNQLWASLLFQEQGISWCEVLSLKWKSALHTSSARCEDCLEEGPAVQEQWCQMTFCGHVGWLNLWTHSS